MNLRPVLAGMLLATLSAVGCTQGTTDVAGGGNSASGGASGGDYVLAAEPADAKGVAEARESAQDGDDVTVVGRIGGDHEPFIDGAAAFTIVDPKLQPCPAEEGCPTPWDYCCDLNLLKDNKAVVKVVNEQGQLVNSDARELLGVEELSTVTVQGKAQRDDAGNLTILATGIHVK
ncbi:MAG: hypothetical protein KY475_13780 [Planctomycetes bacterium]|nr:hypothetical protein [Planctomycetota bacterium]